MLDHLHKPLCPRLSKYDRQKLLLLETNDCVPIESVHPDFSADICFSPYMCNEGLVRIRRRDRLQCKEANMRYPISGNATHDAFHRQFSGPDSFHVVFSGSEKLSPPDWYHAGQCHYIFPFHISNPGKLSLDIIHLYDNFGAVVEQSKEWPVLQRKKVVDSLPLEICRGCPSHVARPRFPSPITFNDMKKDIGEENEEITSSLSDRIDKLPNGGDTDRPSILTLGMSGGSSLRNRYQSYTSGKNQYDKLLMDENYDNLPLCSRDHAIQGAWLPAHPLDKQSWRRANYTWTPLGCRLGKPLDKTCLARNKGGSKVLFQGDTYLRVAMEDLLRRLNGTTVLDTIRTTSATVDKWEEKYESTTFTYIHDPLFTTTGVKTDMIVANMGHWATGTKFFDQLMSTSKYHDKLRDLIETIQQHARDRQDLQDEDDLSLGRFLDDDDYGREADDEDGREYETEEEDDDEAELERKHEERLRQEELDKENDDGTVGGEHIYWEDETEQEIEIETRPKETNQRHRRPTPQELEEQQEAIDDIEDKYRITDRQRAESEGYYSRESDSDPLDRPRARYPSNRILRQSKHVKTHAKPKVQTETIDDEIEEDERDIEEEDQPHIRGRYRYGAQKKVIIDDNSRLMKTDEAKAIIPSSTPVGNINKNKKATARKAIPLSTISASTKKSTYARIRKETISSKDNNNKNKSDSKKTRNTRRSFLDDDYPFLTPSPASPKLPSTSSSLSSSSPSSSKPLIKMAWVGMVAYPETQDADSFVSHDWRTIYRLRYWNLIAEDTLSMLDTSPDRAHYFGTDAAEAMLEELAFKLDLCDNV
ncbi:hypothetical protein FBU30_005997 [Linnemannia zychae]|nr:hypothetical protein FBU30_005997 [Linnemannia zychae]